MLHIYTKTVLYIDYQYKYE